MVDKVHLNSSLLVEAPKMHLSQRGMRSASESVSTQTL